ncbi:Crp/Fnr family transcriptional regulator [Roseomonas chloroacetimidivorans]|uniref:Crp/Fnr family transcriptional regulator n=1 Tax=Roseomonas chloroacetimidivorans TaxID=1766656 RepID=UPI003C77111D
MAASVVSTPTTRNRLLSALPPEVLAALWPDLSPVEFALRDVIQEPGKPITAVHFPESCFASMLAYTEDGDAAEVGMIGRDGMVGLALLAGEDGGDDLEAMVQGPGTALRMEAGAFRAALDRFPPFRALLRYGHVHHGQVARTAACNARHGIEQRLARWLLMSHDRVEGDAFPMTHDFLGLMLGVRRAGISVAAGLLQRAGMIRYAGGRMEVTDRPGLESVSCECYGMVRRASDRLLGLSPGERAPYRA